jgi:CBS domain-containing protein
MRSIAALMQREVVKATLDDSVAVVEAAMTARGLSWMPVVEADGAVLGVISSAELLRFHAEGKDAAAVPAWQLCNYRPPTVTPDTSVSDVARLMVDRGIHHVVVADQSGLCGVVSSLDFVRTFVVPAAR